jgi:hypothetical protein
MIDHLAELGEADLQPCETVSWSSRRLWSLWDMLGKYAQYFFILSELLLRLHQQLGLPPPPVFNPQDVNLLGLGSLAGLLAASPGTSSGGITGGGIGNALALPLPPPPSPSPNTLTEDERGDIAKNLDFVESICRDLGMTGIIKDIRRAKKDATQLFADRSKMQFHIEHITDRLVDDLENESFFHVPAEKEKYCRKNDLFGPDVGKKFPKAIEDLTNAGTAYALSLNTSCVFHLMRVMEHCVQRFGRKLKVTINVDKESWANIMDHVNNAVKGMPGGRHAKVSQNKKKERYSLAAARLDHVRIVWRNDTMHPKATYDEKEALEILTGVGAFLESIVTLV